MKLHPDTLAQLLSLRDSAEGVSTDTRSPLEDKMFIALRGKNFDGNAFVKSALEQGASHAVTSSRQWIGTDNVTVVEDELGAMQALARAYRRRWDCPVLAMTGSNGKTTTKELIRDVLFARFEVHATLGNLNNHIGVPLTLLNAPAKPQFVIVEMGANHRQEIEMLATISEPNHGYITNIGLAHLAGFGGEQGVYLGKKELFDHLAKHDGTAFVQQGDDKVVRASQGVASCIDVPTPEWSWTTRPGGGGYATRNDKSIEVNLEGRYNLANVVAAVTIGEHFGVAWEDVRNAISTYVPSNHRSQSMSTEHNWVILDAYNANPSSMNLALLDFQERRHAAPLAILGDMAELGDASAEAHQKVAHNCLSGGVELWSVGTSFGDIFTSNPEDSWTHFDSIHHLTVHLRKNPIRERQILLKGSRSAALERLLPYL